MKREEFLKLQTQQEENKKQIDELLQKQEKAQNDYQNTLKELGFENEEQYKKLKNAGVSRVHNNLETSENYFKNVCTSHTFEDKIHAVKAAQNAGLSVCSGGIMGLGETDED